MRIRTHSRTLACMTLTVALFATACGSDDTDSAADDTAMEEDTAMADDPAGGDVSGDVIIDGSSTVGPLTDAIAEEYKQVTPDVNVTVGVSGSGGGFERFCGTGDTDISNASRPIKDEEAQLCADNGIEFTEVRVGTDALTMVVSPENSVECLTQDQIIQIWGPDHVSDWSEVEGSDFSGGLEVFAPSSDSGTYDFFNETVLEPNDIEAPRQDYSATENDNDIVRGVQGTAGGWGYFGFAFFQENTDSIKALAYDAGDGCVEPSVETAQDDSYKLTRPLFIYVKSESLATKPQVAAFAEYYLDTVNSVIADVGYIAAPDDVIEQAKSDLEAAIADA